LSEDTELCYECSETPPAGWWKEAVAGWGSVVLPNLKKLTVDNAYGCADDHCASLDLAFTTLLTSASINTVTIKHLQDSCKIEGPNISQFPKTLKKLHLSVATWYDLASPDQDLELSHRHQFFNIRLNAVWLRPLHSQLTHLTLHCNTYWGVYPQWQPGNLHFPQLKSLAFGSWTIAYDWQIAFITSHGETLEQLIFTYCPILHALRMTPRQCKNSWQEHVPGTGRGKPYTDNFFTELRWHIVLKGFESKLLKLKDFSMARGTKGRRVWFHADLSGDEAFEARYIQAPRIDASRYAIFDYGNGPAEWIDITSGYHKERGELRYKSENHFEDSDWLERSADAETRMKAQFPDCLREDQEALEDLLAALRSR
jgi:hypothetical protein